VHNKFEEGWVILGLSCMRTDKSAEVVVAK
jgi:hypothetical protein